MATNLKWYGEDVIAPDEIWVDVRFRDCGHEAVRVALEYREENGRTVAILRPQRVLAAVTQRQARRCSE